MSERRAQVYVPATGRALELEGLQAELVVLIATTVLSTKMLTLLLKLINGRQKIDALRSGRMEVDMSPGNLHLYLREVFGRARIADDETEQQMEAS